MIGQVVDGHEIVRSLGVGGMGEVYLAKSSSGELRAFKIVRADRDASQQAAARFRREVETLGRLRHPNIVQILDAGRLDSGALYLGMEYVAGPNLQGAIGWEGAFAVRDALDILIQMASALAYAHGVGIVHRDLKPSNVLLCNGDPRQTKIIDFGLAKFAAEEGLTRLTDDQELVGSPLYWAPEQSSDADVGPAADVYALGGIAYFALSGKPLFRPRPTVAMVYAHLHETPERLDKRTPDVAAVPGLDALIAACVAKAPGDRPTAARLVGELERLRGRAPSSPDPRRRNAHLFTTTGMSNVGQALTNQIRATLLDLADALEHPINDIDRLHEELSTIELELAVISSEAESTGDAAAVDRRDAMAATVAGLKDALADAFRGLFDAIDAERPRADTDVRGLFGELDTLVEQYRTL